MKFCFLTTFFPPKHFGGDAIFVAKLANSLAAIGHEVHVVHCEDSFDMLAGPVTPSPFPLHDRVTVHSLRLGPVSPLITYFTGRPGLKKQTLLDILALGFDVVHWHNVSLIGGPGALQLAGGVRLCTLHEYWLMCPTHILFKYGKEACRERACIACTLAHGRPPQPWRFGSLIKDSLRFVDLFLAPSDFVRQTYAESSLGLEAHVLPHFIERQTPAVPTPDHPPGYFLFVGRLETAKGLGRILPLFDKPGRRLIVAGTGTQEQELRKAAMGNPRIQFLGRVRHDALASLYAGALATLVPSICFETFGFPVLESLEQATPVIVSDFGALPELVRKTQGGWIYDSMTACAAIVDKLEADPGAAREAGLRGQSQLSQFRLEPHLDRYFKLIESVKSRQVPRELV